MPRSLLPRLTSHTTATQDFRNSLAKQNTHWFTPKEFAVIMGTLTMDVPLNPLSSV